MDKIQIAEQLRRALQMFAESLSDEEAMEVACVYDEWKSGKKYFKDKSSVLYGVNAVGDPQLYRCNQDHTSQDDWTPDVAVSLWRAVGVAPDGVDVWSRPAGAHDAYNIGDRVHYPEKADPIYVSKIDGNVYSPDEYPAGWEMEDSEE